MTLVATEGELSLDGPNVWVEKTEVKGQPGRMSGPHALGKALWSPQRSKANADIYRAMRQVKPGDTVLHLTDKLGITGVSRIASEVDDTFIGLDGTKWAGVPAYRIALREYEPLEPPLRKEFFFNKEPFRTQLLRLGDEKVKNLFFNTQPKLRLNEGGYFTPAPRRLADTLNAAYQAATGSWIPLLPIPLVTPDKAIIENSRISIDASALVFVAESFGSALRECGIEYGARHDSLVRSFVASMATKRFVILTGLSGSGKTQLALRFGEWLGSGRLLTVPVRPDWTGSDALFGFEDALQVAVDGHRAWQVPDALKFMLDASRDPTKPYLLLLDEMNLAHVERYFADVLSGMESGQPCLPNLFEDTDGHWRTRKSVAQKLEVPANLFVVGTVNVDETTYMFSPKVLDRANTFEFRVDAGDLNPEARKPEICNSGAPELVASFAAISADRDWHNQHPAPGRDDFVRLFTKLHDVLAAHGFEYGHRTFVEAIRFAALFAATGDTSALNALDLQVMQKILPRMHGARRRMEPALRHLAYFCIDPVESASGDANAALTFDPIAELKYAPKLPISFDKIRRMMLTLRANQFVSFTE